VRAVITILPLGDGYKIMAMLHIITVVTAFGPLFMYPALRKAGETTAMAQLHMRLVFPSLVVLWVIGMGLAGMSEDVYEMSQTWLALSIVNWAIMMAVSWFLIRPAISDSSQPAIARLAAGVGITHIGLVIGLILMVWKPGL